MILTRSLMFCLVLLLAIDTQAQHQVSRIRYVEFFGTSGLEVQKVKEALAVYQGQEISFDKIPDLIPGVIQSVKSTGYEPTEVAPVCCDDQGRLVLFVGLAGKNYRTFSYNPAPHGVTTLPPAVVNLYQQEMDLLLESI